MSEKRLMSLDDLFGDKTNEETTNDAINEIEIEKLVPYSNHPFRLYEGERLNDMVRSIKNFGVIVPVIVRQKEENIYEVLSGHNRVNAAKLAGLTKVPAVIKEGLSEEDAMLIVTETNLIQRSFGDLSYSEKAIVLSKHYEAIKQQGLRTDLINEIERLSKSNNICEDETSRQVGEKLKTDKKIADKYDLSSRNVSRYIRLTNLTQELLIRVNNEEIAFIPAVTLSFVRKEEQEEIERILEENNFKIDMTKADKLKAASQTRNLTADKIYAILSGEKKEKVKKQSFDKKQINEITKCFAEEFEEEKSPTEMVDTIKKALKLYFAQQLLKENNMINE